MVTEREAARLAAVSAVHEAERASARSRLATAEAHACIRELIETGHPEEAPDAE